MTPNDSRALAEGIERVLKNEADYGRYQQAALKKAAQYDILNLAQQMIEVYQRAGAAKKEGHTIQMNEVNPIFKIDWKKHLQLEKLSEKITELQTKIVSPS